MMSDIMVKNMKRVKRETGDIVG